jgi:hypothetical protein
VSTVQPPLLSSMGANGLSRKCFLLRKAKLKYTGSLSTTLAGSDRRTSLVGLTGSHPGMICSQHGFPFLNASGRRFLNGMGRRERGRLPVGSAWVSPLTQAQLAPNKMAPQALRGTVGMARPRIN